MMRNNIDTSVQSLFCIKAIFLDKIFHFRKRKQNKYTYSAFSHIYRYKYNQK